MSTGIHYTRRCCLRDGRMKDTTYKPTVCLKLGGRAPMAPRLRGSCEQGLLKTTTAQLPVFPDHCPAQLVPQTAVPHICLPLAHAGPRQPPPTCHSLAKMSGMQPLQASRHAPEPRTSAGRQVKSSCLQLVDLLHP